MSSTCTFSHTSHGSHALSLVSDFNFYYKETSLHNHSSVLSNSTRDSGILTLSWCSVLVIIRCCGGHLLYHGHPLKSKNITESKKTFHHTCDSHITIHATALTSMRILVEKRRSTLTYSFSSSRDCKISASCKFTVSDKSDGVVNNETHTTTSYKDSGMILKHQHMLCLNELRRFLLRTAVLGFVDLVSFHREVENVTISR